MPDALERAAELDAQYGTAPDLAALPMYCVPFSFKDPFDTKDMRSTGGGDARYDIDFPARDHTLVAQLRAKGAIIYAKANTDRIQRPRRRSRRQEHARQGAASRRSATSAARGAATRATRTTRRAPASLGSSSGSGVSVGANLVMCSLCEETRRLVPRPGQPQLGGADPAAEGADLVPRRRHRLGHPQRPHRHPSARPITDSAKVLDALKDPVERLLRSARRVHDDPAIGGARRAVRADRGDGRAPGLAQGHAHRDHPRVDAEFPGVKADEPIVKAAATRDQASARRAPRRDAGRIDRPALDRTTGRSRT